MKHEHSVAVESCSSSPTKNICWSAVLAGAFIAVGLGFLLNLFAVAIGLSAFTLDNKGGEVLAIGGLVGILIGAIVTMLAAGYTAGYLSRMQCPTRKLGIIYGFTTWTISLLLSAIVTTQVGHYISSYSNTISHPAIITYNATDTDKMTSVTETTTTTITAAPESTKAAAMPTSPTSLAWSAFIVFVLFLIGAIACCVGACCGIGCQRITTLK